MGRVAVVVRKRRKLGGRWIGLRKRWTGGDHSQMSGKKKSTNGSEGGYKAEGISIRIC